MESGGSRRERERERKKRRKRPQDVVEAAREEGVKTVFTHELASASSRRTGRPHGARRTANYEQSERGSERSPTLCSGRGSLLVWGLSRMNILKKLERDWLGIGKLLLASEGPLVGLARCDCSSHVNGDCHFFRGVARSSGRHCEVDRVGSGTDRSIHH